MATEAICKKISLKQEADRWASLAHKAAAEDTSLDVKGIIWLEHINIVVGNPELAEIFYFEGLGLTKDPSKTGPTIWANVGPRQQFHLVSASPGDEAQRLYGSIGLALPDLRALCTRLESVTNSLKGSSFLFEDCGDMVAVTCPWGNQFFVFGSNTKLKSKEGPPPAKVRRTTVLEEKHASVDHVMGVREQPGIRFVQMACRDAEGVARFYQSTFGCCVRHEGSGDVAVCVGPSVHLIFNSYDDGLTDSERSSRIQQASGIHICVYISDFKQTYEHLLKIGVIWTNPRFAHLDACDSYEEAVASRQFRFKCIRDPTTGQELLELEHETRALRHLQFMKEVKYEEK